MYYTINKNIKEFFMANNEIQNVSRIVHDFMVS